RKLKKEYGSKDSIFKAIDNIDLKVYKGEFLGIMGPSGAGKTTLLNMLSTIDKPTSGNIYYEDKDIGNMKNRELSVFRRNNIGFIFQDFNLLDSMSVEDNIALPLALSKVNSKEIKSKVEKLSSFFGLKDQIKKYPYQLSGGQKQRVAAARALITSPSIVFADEPTGALDSKSSQELLQCLSKMNEEFNTTIIMVTHDAFSASYCKRILFIKDGKIHTRIDKDSSRKEFFKRIIDLLGSMGGGVDELF
ncbi:bacitracin ABC transporter ATP-binding protein, partial [Clostridium sp. cpc1]|uniref:ABC transporter ATP-binding protein n=1 Tax=Clostridium sp. cpc1 TaxID=2016536 RepID=UPI00223F5015